MSNSEGDGVTVAFVNAHVIVGDECDIDSGTVVIEEGRIIEVGDASRSPAAEVVVDLEGRTLMPGLIDTHTHLVGGDKTLGFGDESTSFRLGEPLVKNLLDGVDAATVTLNSGVTAVRDVSARNFADVFMRRAQAAGQIVCPRMLVTGPALAMTGGHGHELVVDHEADSPTEIVKRVRWLVANGVDFIKTVSADGPETLGEWTTVQFTFEEVAAAFTEARRLGRPTMAHAMGPEAIDNVVRAGSDTVEHGWYLNEENCRLMAEKGTYLVPTLGCAIDIIRKGPSLMMTWAETMAGDEAGILERHAMAFELGVKFAMGSDCGGNESRVHGTNASELVHQVKCGMSNRQAITSGTLEAARAIGMDRVIGSIEAGKFADLLVVDRDPFSDVSAIESSLVGVLQGGRVVRDDLGLLGDVRRVSTPARTTTATASLPQELASGLEPPDGY